MSMTNEEYRRYIARLMRESADLIERGVITDVQIDIEFGHATRPDPRTGGYTMHTISTGERMVTLKMRSNDFQRADWEQAAERGDDGRQLPRPNLRLPVPPVK